MAKIAIVLPDLRFGGVECLSVTLADQFACAGHEVVFLLLQCKGELLADVQSRFDTIEMGVTRLRELPKKVVTVLRECKTDAVLCSVWPITFIVPLVVKLAQLPLVVVTSEHGLLSEQFRHKGFLHYFVMRLSMAVGYRLADACVAVSTGVKKEISCLSCLHEDAFTVIHNPIPIPKWPSVENISEAAQVWPKAKYRLLAVGRLKSVKNYPLLLEALSLTLQEKDVSLVILGEGDEKSRLIDYARELNVSANVCFAGFQQYTSPFYVCADLLVMSSNREGFGNVIVESLATGTPVVSTDCPSGPAEILNSRMYGSLSPTHDPIMLANTIVSTLDRVFDYDVLKARAEDFGPSKIAKQYLSLLSPEG